MRFTFNLIIIDFTNLHNFLSLNNVEYSIIACVILNQYIALKLLSKAIIKANEK